MQVTQLQLIDRQTGAAIGQRAMSPGERYQTYRQCFAHELLLFQEHLYTIHSVAWRPHDEACVVRVTYHSRPPLGCTCDC
jgi:hypothetical protein